MGSGPSLDFTHQELSNIEHYRLRRQTSVLVIPFTDIKSLAEIGERRGDTGTSPLAAMLAREGNWPPRSRRRGKAEELNPEC